MENKKMDSEKLLEVIEQVQASGKIKKGINEVTKFVERGQAKLVIAASDVSPKEIIMHLPILAKEKGAAYGEVASKEELGAAAGLGRPTAAVCITDGGNAKDLLAAVCKELGAGAKEEKAEAKEEAPAEETKEEAPKAEEKPAEDAPAEEAKEEPAEEKKEE